MKTIGVFAIVCLATVAACQASLRTVWNAAERVALWLLPEPMKDLPGVDDLPI